MTFVGTVKIINNSGTVSFGSTANNSSKSVTKAFSGSGGNNTGTVNIVINNNSQTNVGSAGADPVVKCKKKRVCRARKRNKKKKS